MIKKLICLLFGHKSIVLVNDKRGPILIWCDRCTKKIWELKGGVMETKAFLRELCEECGGCSEMPTSIEDLCSNPLEKYLYRMCKTETEAYFRGRQDGLMMREARQENK